MKSHLWAELLAGCQALPCVITAPIPVTVLLAEQSRLVLQCAALLGAYVSFVPAQFLNLSEAQMPQGWTPVFVIKLLICVYSIPTLFRFVVKPSLTDMLQQCLLLFHMTCSHGLSGGI